MSSRHSRADLDRFHEYGVFVPTRTIYVGSETTDLDGNESGTDALMVSKIVKNLHVLDQTEGPITVITNNCGGDCYDGFAIYDAIRGCKNPVTVKVVGQAMSMGSIILQAASSRVMTANSSQMIHYGYMSFSGHAKTAMKWSAQEARLMRRMEEIYLARMKQAEPKMTLKALRRLLNHDTFLTADESVALGLADVVE